MPFPATLTTVRRIADTTAAATLVLIGMGGVVRATDSGLACPDWPACYGQWVPPAELSLWLEHSHRLWAGVVMLLLAALAATAWRVRDEAPWVWRLAAFAAVAVLVQAALGAAVVLALLRPGLVMTHLLLSLLVVGTTLVIGVLTRPGATTERRARGPLAGPATAVALLVLGQATLGSYGTGRGIAYVLSAVPIWRAEDVWVASAAQELHVAHRVSGYVVAFAVLWLARALRVRRPRAAAWLPRAAVGLVLVQVVLGIANVLTHGAPTIAAGHLAVAGLLWAVTVRLAAHQWVGTAVASARVEQPAPALVEVV